MNAKWWREEIKRIYNRKKLGRILGQDKLELDIEDIEKKAEEAQERLSTAIHEIQEDENGKHTR